MANPIIHFEIIESKDQKAALQEFYQKAFDWQIEPMGEMQYGAITKPEGEIGIGGAVDAAPTGHGVVIYLGVDDIHAALASATANGAEVVADVMVIPGMVTFAQFRDPAGNVLGLVANEVPEG